MRRVINSLAVLVLLFAPAGGSADGLSANANGEGEAAVTYVNPVGGDLQMGDPFVMLHKGQYYGIGYATARAPLGPWTKCVHNPIVAKNLDLAVSGPGHCSITTSPDGAELFMVYHTHADVLHPSGRRTVNIDRLLFQEDGTLRLIGPTRSPQPMPSGCR
jgi:hypothetical protein